MHNIRLTEDGRGDYSVPSHLMKTKSAQKIMDSHTPEIDTMNNAFVSKNSDIIKLGTNFSSPMWRACWKIAHCFFFKQHRAICEYSSQLIFFTLELFLHSFNLHSISSSHAMRGRIIFEDLDTTLHVSTFCLLDTMHMARSPRPPTLPSVLPYSKCVKLEEYTGGQHSEIHIPFVRLNRWSWLVHPLSLRLVFWMNVDPGWIGAVGFPYPANTAILVTPTVSS